MADKQIVDAIQGAVPPAACLAELESRRGELVRLAYRLCWNLTDAEDAVQDAFLQATRHLDQLEDRSRVWPWLRAIVVRQCHDIIRQRVSRAARHDRLRQSHTDTASDNPYRDVEKADLGDKVLQLIVGLPDRQRFALVLRHLEELPYTEVAELMGIGESTARVLVHDARQSIQRKLGQADMG